MGGGGGDERGKWMVCGLWWGLLFSLYLSIIIYIPAGERWTEMCVCVSICMSICLVLLHFTHFLFNLSSSFPLQPSLYLVPFFLFTLPLLVFSLPFLPFFPSLSPYSLPPEPSRPSLSLPLPSHRLPLSLSSYRYKYMKLLLLGVTEERMTD